MLIRFVRNPKRKRAKRKSSEKRHDDNNNSKQKKYTISDLISVSAIHEREEERPNQRVLVMRCAKKERMRSIKNVLR